jgi:hypothetical protein
MSTGGPFPGGKAAGAWSWPLTSNQCWGQENVDIYIHFTMRLQGVVLNCLSTGTTLPLLLCYKVIPINFPSTKSTCNCINKRNAISAGSILLRGLLWNIHRSGPRYPESWDRVRPVTRAALAGKRRIDRPRLLFSCPSFLSTTFSVRIVYQSFLHAGFLIHSPYIYLLRAQNDQASQPWYST